MDWNIFISYSRTDNQVLVDEPMGWVDRFQRDLQVAVSQAVGVRAVKVWTDGRLDGNEYFEATIDEVTAHSSLLVPIISNAYLLDENGWLKRERESFIKGAVKSGGLRLGNKSRICPILRQPIDINDPRIPEEIRALNLKHKFHDSKGYVLRGDAHRDRITDVAGTIKSMFEELAKFTAPAPPPKRNPKSVYLASATPDVDFQRDMLAKELTRKGYTTLPKDPLPDAEDEMKDAIEKDLSTCCLSVHMVGALLDPIPNETRRAIELQHATALRESARGLLQIVWTPGYLNLDTLTDGLTEPAKSFYTNLRRPSGFRYSRENFERLLNFVLSTLEELREPPPETPGVDLPPGVMRKAYVVCDPADRHLLEPLRKWLLPKEWWVEFPPETNDEKDFTELHHKHMRDCQAFVIYYGSTSRIWVDLLRVEYRDAQTPIRRLPLYSKWIYRGPKESPEKQNFLPPIEDYELDGDFEHPWTEAFTDRLIRDRRLFKIGNVSQSGTHYG